MFCFGGRHDGRGRLGERRLMAERRAPSGISYAPMPYAVRFLCGGATAAPGQFPYAHRTLENIWAQIEERDAALDMNIKARRKHRTHQRHERDLR